MDYLPEKIDGIPTKDIENRILIIRNQQVMIDRDLAELYGVETKRLNEQVKRNNERFPSDFCFQLNDSEFENWRSHFATSNSDKMGVRRAPYAFTEQGVAMLASVLKSETAINASVLIMRAFVAMRRFLQNNTQLFLELNTIKKHLGETDLHLMENDKKIEHLFSIMDRYKLEEKQEYPTLTLHHTTAIHDRFLIIDQSVLYHIGASLKDLGKKCFAFEIMEDATRLIPMILAST